ncbi:MAG: pitrilysin family protein [Candidatus Aminicenantales bacterium]
MKRVLVLSLCLLGFHPVLMSQERFRKFPPSPEPLQEPRLPNIETVRLSNELTLSVAYRENMPVTFLQLIIYAGESASPESLPGMASFAAHMVSRGTQTLSATSIEERIEQMGGTFSVSTFMDYSLWTLSFLDEYLDDALNILSQLILSPAFAEREIDTVKRILFYDLLEKEKDPEFSAKRHLQRILFKNHPYQKGTFNERVIRNLNQKDLISFFQKYYRPNNAHIILIGNLNMPTASRKVSHYLNTWVPQAVEENLYFSPPKPNEKEKVCFIDVPHVKDCIIYLGNTILSLSQPDSYAFFVLNQVLGGAPISRLFMNLRESKGYAYYAYSDMEFYRLCGIFFVRARVTPEVIYSSVQEIIKEIRVLTKEPISIFEIEQAKSYLMGNFPLRFESWDNLARKIAEMKALYLEDNYWRNFCKNIMLVNSENVFETSHQYPLLTPMIVIAGDKEILLGQLKDFDVVEVYDNKGIFQYSIQK